MMWYVAGGYAGLYFPTARVPALDVRWLCAHLIARSATAALESWGPTIEAVEEQTAEVLIISLSATATCKDVIGATAAMAVKECVSVYRA